MRMWMINPRVLCRQHLLGEHRELHTFVGTIKKGHRLDGYVKHNCLEAKSIEARHSALVDEMASRGYNHQSPLEQPDLNEYSEYVLNSKVCVNLSLVDLMFRCKKCCERTSTIFLLENDS